MTIRELSIQEDSSAREISSVHDKKGSRALIAPERGALLTSWVVEGRELLYLDHATFRDASKNVRGGIPVLFPTPGKLSNDRWEYDGRKGVLPQHGFARTQSWSVVAHRDNELVLRLVANAATRAGFPWSFTAELRFTLLARSLRIGLTVGNDDTERMPFACGFHPYFLVGDKSKVRIPSPAAWTFNNISKQVEAMRELRLADGEVDLHLLDHRSDRAELQLGDGTSIIVRGSPEFWLWVIWTLPDKNFICLEPWTAQGNALNAGERLLVLEPGAERQLWMELEVRAA